MKYKGFFKHLKNKYFISLVIIFLAAVFIRFLYFPGNIYFGFDQARDAYTIKELLSGNLKVVGPTTSIEGLYHGSLYYYIFAPFYFLTDGDPIGVAAFLRVLNAFGVVLVFAITAILFTKRAGILAAFLYAISFEQTQFSIYINHPSLSIISALIYYLGWSLFLFKKSSKGLVIMFAGLGLSLQFEFVMVYLLITSFILGIIFYKDITKIDKKTAIYSSVAFLLPLITYIIVEVKNGFKSFQIIPKLFDSSNDGGLVILGQLWFILQRYFTYNIFSFQSLNILAVLVFLGLVIYYIRDKSNRLKIIFLLIWFLGGFINYTKSYSSIPILHYGAGASVSLLVLFGFFLDKMLNKSYLLPLLLLTLTFFSNINLISRLNAYGSIPEVNVQSKMLLSDQKEAIDYIYNQSGGGEFSVNALSMPLNVNIVWGYLFETYGMRSYGYLPFWGGDAADGYPGVLKVEKARSKLPDTRFLIIEPTRGIYPHLIDEFISQENFFSKVVEVKEFGALKVEKRVRI